MSSKSSPDTPLNLLIAYPYMSKGILDLLKENEKHIRFFLDSGAFTAWKSGKPIQLDDYCKFLESLPITPWRYFALDVIGDPAGTERNYQLMLKRGFKPVPIFTRGEELAKVDELYETSDMIAVGGLVGTEGNRGFVKGIMIKIGKRKVHWLGFTNLDFMRVYKPYSTDSSSWESGARFGQVSVYTGGGRKIKITRTTAARDIMNFNLRVALERYGFDPMDTLDPKNWRGGQSFGRLLGAASVLQIQKEYGEAFDTKVFAAATTDYAIRILLEARERIYGESK